jgi:hypothetical protein
MGRCKAPRRRRCGTSSRSGNAEDARPPPHPAGRPVLRHATYYADRHLIDKPESRPQNVKLFLRGPLAFSPSFCLKRNSFSGNLVSSPVSGTLSPIPESALMCVSTKRLSLYLTVARFRSGPFAPRALPRFFTTMSLSDSQPVR